MGRQSAARGDAHRRGALTRKTGRPKEWAHALQLGLLVGHAHRTEAGAYEFRARAVDLNNYAQPEPRPYPKSGRNEIQQRVITVMG